MPDDISITIDDKNFSGWSKIIVDRSIEDVTSSFSFQVVDNQNQQNNQNWPLQTQSKAVIKVNDVPIINGFIDRVSVGISKESHTITISGRDKTSDLVDTTAFHPGTKYTLKKTTIFELALFLSDPYGIRVELDRNVEIDDTFDITFKTSESPYEIMDRKAKELGLMLITNERGSLVITNSVRETTTDSLVMGTNILSANMDFDYTNRFSKYIVNSQISTTANWGGNINVTAEAEDPNVSRFRPLLIQGESQMNRAKAQKRANWEANVRAARSQVVNIKVQGFTQTNGDLWQINKLVEVDAPELYINPPILLLITSVQFNLNENGTTTTLSLKREDAYTRLPPKKVKAQNKLGWP